jgi:hypothetical protein
VIHCLSPLLAVETVDRSLDTIVYWYTVIADGSILMGGKNVRGEPHADECSGNTSQLTAMLVLWQKTGQLNNAPSSSGGRAMERCCTVS